MSDYYKPFAEDFIQEEADWKKGTDFTDEFDGIELVIWSAEIEGSAPNKDYEIQLCCFLDGGLVSKSPIETLIRREMTNSCSEDEADLAALKNLREALSQMIDSISARTSASATSKAASPASPPPARAP